MSIFFGDLRGACGLVCWMTQPIDLFCELLCPRLEAAGRAADPLVRPAAQNELPWVCTNEWRGVLSRWIQGVGERNTTTWARQLVFFPLADLLLSRLPVFFLHTTKRLTLEHVRILSTFLPQAPLLVLLSVHKFFFSG